MYNNFKSVCNSSSSTAFELAAALIFINKERNGGKKIIKIKLIHKARNGMKTKLQIYYIKSYKFKISKKKIIDIK